MGLKLSSLGPLVCGLKRREMGRDTVQLFQWTPGFQLVLFFS